MMTNPYLISQKAASCSRLIRNWDVTIVDAEAPTDKIIESRTARITIAPFALYDLNKMAKMVYKRNYVSFGGGSNAKKKIEVTVSTGFSLSSIAKH
ncbi:hypothetical protein P7H06_15615 [Paenibacillus larvae]|nr:hypothetical protein [Paenibacillus larvae]MDT2260649.1 hypothetical protein [Paenibacillus larvae]